MKAKTKLRDICKKCVMELATQMFGNKVGALKRWKGTSNGRKGESIIRRISEEGAQFSWTDGDYWNTYDSCQNSCPYELERMMVGGKDM